MNTYTGLLILSFGAAALFVPLAARLARRLGSVETVPGKDGSVPAAKVGGAAIYPPLFLPLVAVPLLGNRLSEAVISDPRLLITLAGCSLVILAFGIADDAKPQGPLVRLAVVGGAAAVMFLSGLEIGQLSNPFGEGTLHLGALSGPVTVLWIVLITSLMRLLAGIPGAAAGASAIAAFAIASGTPADTAVGVWLMAACVMGAALGFLLHSFPPGRVVADPSTATLLGFIVAVISVPFTQKSTALVSLGMPVLALALPVARSFVTTAVRIAERFSASGKADVPLPARLFSIRMNAPARALAVYTVVVLCSMVAITLGYTMRSTGLLALTFLLLFLGVLFQRVGRAEDAGPSGVPDERRSEEGQK